MVWALTVDLGYVLRTEIHIYQLAKAYNFGIIDNLDCLGMVAVVLIGRILGGASAVARNGFLYSFYALINSLYAPKASAGKICLFQSVLGSGLNGLLLFLGQGFLLPILLV